MSWIVGSCVTKGSSPEKVAMVSGFQLTLSTSGGCATMRVGDVGGAPNAFLMIPLTFNNMIEL